MKTDWKSILGSATDLLSTVSPLLAAAVKAGSIAVEVYNDFEAAREDVARLAAQDKVTTAEIDALDDRIQVLTNQILAKD